MVAIRIPGVESIERVGVARDSGVRATPDEFGSGIGQAQEQLSQQQVAEGHALSHLGDTAVHVGALLKRKSEDATDAVASDTYRTQYEPAATQAIYDAQREHPDGGPEYAAKVRQKLDDIHQSTLSSLSQQGLTPSDRGLQALNHVNAAYQADYLIKGVTIAHNAQITNLQEKQEQNVAAFNAQVLSGQMPVEDARRGIDGIIRSSRQLYSPEQLKQKTQEWHEGAVDAAIRGKLDAALTRSLAGDEAGAEALKNEARSIRSRYYGATQRTDAEKLHPQFADSLSSLRALLRSDYGLETGIASGARTTAEQARLYAQGRTAPGPIVTHAPPGASYHNYGAAADLAPQNMNEAEAGKIIGKAIQEHPELGLTWGGTFKNLYDPLHVQLNAPIGKLKQSEADESSTGDTAPRIRLAQASTGTMTDASGGADITLPGTPTQGGVSAPIMPNSKKAVYWDQQFEAFGLDERRAILLRKQKAQESSDATENSLLKDIYSDQPKTTVQSIVNNDGLTREAKERLVGVAQRAYKKEPIAQVSHQETTNLLDRIRRPDGDPLKVTDNQPIYDAFIEGKLKRTDFDFLRKEFQDIRTPEGEQLGARKKLFIDAVKGRITKSNPLMGRQDPDGDAQLYNLQWSIERKVDEFRKSGKNPFDLFDPSKPDFMGKEEAIQPYTTPLDKSLETKTQSITRGAAAPWPSIGGAPAVPARNPGESPDDYLKRIGKK